MKNKFLLPVVLPLIFLMSGCAPALVIHDGKPQEVDRRTKLHKLKTDDFRDFAIPDTEEIISGGYQTALPHVTFDEVWDAVVIVAMQRGIVVRVDKATARLVVLFDAPVALYVAGADPVAIHGKLLENLYETLDDTEKVEAKFASFAQERIVKGFCDLVSTQVYASQKWQYLYK